MRKENTNENQPQERIPGFEKLAQQFREGNGLTEVRPYHRGSNRLRIESQRTRREFQVQGIHKTFQEMC